MNLLWQHAISTEIYANVMAAIHPALEHGDPQDPVTAQKVVLDARKAAIIERCVNNNYLISEVLTEAGVNHIPVLSHEPFGPNFLDETTYPELFDAATNAEGDNLVAIIKAIGTAIDLHTPDALHRDRVAILSGFIGRMPLSTSVKSGQTPDSLIVGDQTIPNVLMPYNPNFELKEWTISPYTRTIPPFMLQNAITPTAIRSHNEA